MTAAGAPTHPEPAALRDDPQAWDAFVEAAPTGAYTQLSAWAEAKRSKFSWSGGTTRSRSCVIR